MRHFKTDKGCFFFSLTGIVLSVFFHVYACNAEENKQNHKSPSTAAITARAFTKDGELTFFSKNNKKIITIAIEIPDTIEEKRRGLMYRHLMGDSEGMLFVNDMSQHRFFWMKNTYIPLDMIFIDKKMQIIKIAKNTMPLSEKLIPVPREAQYTIEVNAGFCDKHGIKIGDSIKL